MKVIAMRDGSPLVTIQVVFGTGSAQDPAGQGGVAWMATAMLASGGSRTLTYKQILDALFPIGARRSFGGVLPDVQRDDPRSWLAAG
ncbi:MAG: hypothetical protein IPP47_26785 [Bryobacterales bacterium]|nr:hypothetical protein [Bryobacterales bacterium]